VIPAAHYAVLSSRLIPGLDGGYTVATLAHARLLEAAGAPSPLLLTVDPGTPGDHAAHRETFVARGDATGVDQFRNLFDDAVADPAWLRAAALAGEPAPDIEYREIADAAARPLLSIPVIAGDADWHLTQAPVVVHGAGVIPGGFGGLYRAWLAHVAAGLRGAGPDRPVVVLCESRQLGELIAEWDDPDVRIVHMIHNSHLEPPYDDPHGPMNALWSRWFDRVDAFDAVLWPTEAQRADVVARFGDRTGFAVVPNPVEQTGPSTAPTDPHRVVMLNRLAPQKRVDRAILAWAKVVAALPQARLDIYGDGPDRGALQRLIEELGLEASVRLHGHVDDRDDVFDTAALMLVSTAYEGQGLSIAEALVRGVPVVSFDVRYGPRETIGAAGILVPAADVDALATAVIDVLSDPTLRDRLSGAAIEQGARLDPDRVQEALSAAIGQAVAGPPTHRPLIR
jgi:glycosyltransferase involved in cell wall biosynthesis